MTNFYLKSAVRSIFRKKTFSILNIIGLTLGITIFLLVLEYFSYQSGFNSWHTRLDNLYRVDLAGPNGKSPSTPPALGPDIKKSIPGIQTVARYTDNFTSGAVISCIPRGGKEKLSFQEQRCVFVDKTFLEIFSFPLISGSNQLDDPHAVVITASIAKKLFGNSEPIGQTLKMHNQFGSLPCQVTGVVADPPSQSDITFDYLFSMQALSLPAYIAGSEWASPDSWSNVSYTTYALLAPDTDPDKIAAAATSEFKKDDPQYKKEDGSVTLQPVSEIHLGKTFSDDNPTSGSRATVYAILYLGILVLVIAWINFINFSTAFALSQVKNIGIHMIIGSAKRQIVARYIMESFLLNLAALTLAFPLTDILQGIFNYLTTAPLSIHYLYSWSSWLTGMVILAAGVALCGGYVGWTLARLKPVSALNFHNPTSLGSTWLRKGLVIFQFTISILFIIATLVAYTQVNFMKRHDLGMNIRDLVIVNGPQIRDSSIRAEATAFKNDLANLPFVTASCNTGSIPGPDFAHNYSSDGVTGPAPAKGDDKKEYDISEVDERYFPLYEIPMAEGRNFSQEEVARGYKAGVLILNETAASDLGIHPGAAIHNHITWQDRSWDIIGIVRDYHHQSLKNTIEPIIYVPQNNINRFTLKLTPGSQSQKLSVIKNLYSRYFPGNPFGYSILQDTYNTQYADEDRGVTIALSVSLFIILIAMLGLIGLSIFTVRRRVKEIGIRKVLGATTGSLFRLLSRDFLALIALAFLLATPIAALLLNLWLRNFADHISMSAWHFILPGLIVMLIALLTISIQTIQAALANPTAAIRAGS